MWRWDSGQRKQALNEGFRQNLETNKAAEHHTICPWHIIIPPSVACSYMHAVDFEFIFVKQQMKALGLFFLGFLFPNK